MEEGGKGRQMALTTSRLGQGLVELQAASRYGPLFGKGVITGLVRTGMTRDKGSFFPLAWLALESTE